MQPTMQPNAADGERPSIRVDAAHRVASHTETTPATDPHSAVVLASAAAENAAEQTRAHAAQLAQHLQEKRREVDHRESHLNARIAQLENDLRNSRLWLQERSEEFASREAELAQRIAEQESRIRGLSATELELDDARQQHVHNLQSKDEDLRQRENSLAQSQRRLEEQEKLVLKRQEQLTEQERSFDEQWRQLQEERAVFQLEMAKSNDELILERRTLTELRQQLDEQGAQQRKTWDNRNLHFDERQIALERIRGDILRLHREALEMRLVAEQLWSQMAGRVQPGELTQGIAKLRGQLADEFRFAQQEIVNQRSSLEVLIAKLDAQRRELAAQRDELVGWLSRRQQELAQQSAELVEREQTLAQEKQLSNRLEKHWQAERSELQRQIRQLTLRLRQSDLVAA